MSLSLSSFNEEVATPPPYSPPAVEQPVISSNSDNNNSTSNNNDNSNSNNNNSNIEEGTVAALVQYEFTFTNYLRRPRRFVGRESIFNSFKGFLDILSSQKKLPWRFGINLLY